MNNKRALDIDRRTHFRASSEKLNFTKHRVGFLEDVLFSSLLGTVFFSVYLGARDELVHNLFGPHPERHSKINRVDI